MHRTILLSSVLSLFVSGHAMAQDSAFDVEGDKGTTLRATPYLSFNQPWAMTFLPDGKMLVTEKIGTLVLVSENGEKLGEIEGVPEVRAQGQGGLGDVILHPDFASNNQVYLSYVERDDSDRSLSGAVVIRARLDLTPGGGSLQDIERIWEQVPKVTGDGHYSHRMAFAPDGKLFITSGERQKFTPAQNMAMNLGKIVRLEEDGSVPGDNPFVGQGGVTEQIWTLGHRNLLGIDFDEDGQLYIHEMGPRGGDEVNRIVRSENYGWPEVSDGVHYSGINIPDHASNEIYEKPLKSWVPVISPSGFVIYDGDLFADWTGNGIIGGLSSQAVIRVAIGEEEATEEERYSWGKRIREIEQGPDGAIWVLEDKAGGRLIKLEPAG